MNYLKFTFGLALAGMVAACSSSQASSPATDSRAATGVEAELHRHIAELAADDYEGRAPGTAGGRKTVAYLVQQFKALGLQPGNRGSWYQDVPITTKSALPGAVLRLRGAEIDAAFDYGPDMMVSSQWQQVDEVEVNDSQLVFVGYGINAPERDWNDYAGLDVRGKTVVMLVNDPGYATQDPALFNGNTMTYYGRWDYKYAEAARQGAAAAFIVHETAPAAYPWAVVENSWSGEKVGLTAANQNRDKLKIEGWLPLQRAEQIFAAAGLDYQAAKQAASKPGFKAIELDDIRASVALGFTPSTAGESRNVMGLIPGSKYPDEVIIYTAHWDHLGVRPDQDGDNIYNGASDNASGVAGLFALARLFQSQETPPERSILFLAVTAEESGLLGSKWYGQNPVFPPAMTVANFNMDNIAAGNVGLTHDVAVVGKGNSELEDYLADAVAAQGRVVVQEPSPEKGYYYRSDHFSLAKQGIPALYLTRSVDSVEHGREWGAARLAEYTAKHYHKPSDEYDPSWDLRGAAQEILLLYAMGSRLAANRDFPEWREGVEFKARRDSSRASH